MRIEHLMAVVSLLAFPALAQAAQGAANAPSLTFRNETVQLQEGEKPAPVTVIVEGTNLPLPGTGQDPPPLEVEDVGGAGPPGLTVAFTTVAELEAPVGTTRYWKVHLTANGMAPDSAITRTANLTVGEVGGLADYTLTNEVDGEFTWELSPPPPNLVLGDDPANRRTSLTVTTGARPATDVRIVQSSLRDEATHRILSTDHLDLVGGSEPIRIAPRTTEELTIVVDESFSRPGVFTGSLVLAVDQAAETKTIQSLTIYSSSWRWQLLGVGAICLGVLLSLYVGVIATRKSNRKQALRSAAAVRERLAALAPSLAAADEKAQGSLARLEIAFERAESKLSEEHLDSEDLLPPKWYSLANSEGQGDRFEKHLTAVSERVTQLDEIIGRGVRTVLEWWDPTDPSEHIAALGDLDSLAESGEELAEIRKKVREILQDLESKMRGAGFGAALSSPAPRTTKELDVELAGLGVTVWLLWTAVTVVAGWVALILSEPGFGTGLDIAACFFWGLGVHVAGQQLQQLSPSKISTRFGVPLPDGT